MSSSVDLIKQLIQQGNLHEAERLTRLAPIEALAQAHFFAEIAVKCQQAGETRRSTELFDDAMQAARSLADGFWRAAALEGIANHLGQTGRRNTAVELLVEASWSVSMAEAKTRNGDTEEAHVAASNCGGLLISIAQKLAKLGEWEKAYQAINLGQVRRDEGIRHLHWLQSQQTP